MEINKETYEEFEKHCIPEPNTGCILWTRDKSKYGIFVINKVRLHAHRASYLLFNGEIQNGMVVCHKCDTPGCVNPNHLWLGTIKENLKDRDLKGRNPFSSRNSCSKGHEYVDDSYKIYHGKRICIKCERENAKIRRQMKKLKREIEAA